MSKQDKKGNEKQSLGRPVKLKDRFSVNVSIDKKTDMILKKVDISRSHAIRILALKYEKEFLSDKGKDKDE